ncbi:MAG: peptidylprolyl isomerase, partial [Burkholderiales bacterium]|nr:peptidylprolyl isomerase [Phycisphaerae bacterium]
MRYGWTNGLIVSALIIGCGPKAASPVARPATTRSIQNNAATDDAVDDPVIATIGSTEIKRSQLVAPVMQAHGYSVLMYVVQREMAADACRQQGIAVSPADIEQERKWTLETMFPEVTTNEEREKVLDQYLQQPKTSDQMGTATEFDMVVETNAYLRKLVEPKRAGAIGEAELKSEFERTYGAQVRVRHIMVSNTQEALQARRRLDNGEDFAAVARAMSRNPNTKVDGGELPPFASQDVRLPANFRSVAFSLKPGEISDPVEAEGAFHIIKLEERIDPKAIKYDDVKDSLRQSIQDRWMVEAVKDLRTRLAAQARVTLKIEDPVLRKEFENRQVGRDQLIRDREKIREVMRKQREIQAAQSATAPSTGTSPNGPIVRPSP